MAAYILLHDSNGRGEKKWVGSNDEGCSRVRKEQKKWNENVAHSIFFALKENLSRPG